MKSLLTLPVLMLLLTACGPTPPDSVPEAVESTETVEAAICNLANCNLIVKYYCAPFDFQCGDCAAYNAVTCTTVPSSGNYGHCGEGCAGGGYVTQYNKQLDCDIAATPKLSVNCYKPYPNDTSFTACGQQCPSGFTLSGSWYQSSCDSACVMNDACTNTADNAMWCTRNP